MEKLKSFAELLKTVHRLRAPGGCPWDREQTFQSLRPCLIEEAYEVLDVLDRMDKDSDVHNEQNKADFREELGDLLMQVVLHAEMTREQGAFDIFDVIEELNSKLIRRHPHVFGDTEAHSAKDALDNWEKQKAKEKATNPEISILDSLPKNLPALQKAERTIGKVTRVGFQWDDMKGPVSKLDEEVAELKTELTRWENAPKEERASVQKRIEAELGDVLFSAANIGFLAGVKPEDALRTTLARFSKRFKHIERRTKEEGTSIEAISFEQMDQYWDEAKTKEKSDS